jgi:sortase A
MAERLARYLEVVLLVVGLALLAVFVAVRVYGGVANRMASYQFEALAAQTTTGSGGAKPSMEQGVDFGLWSKSRIEAYKQSLAAGFEIPLAMLSIQRLKLKVPVFEGTEESELNRGAGRIIDTAMPGTDGNIGIAGHRDGFFRCLKDIQIGDLVELATPTQKRIYKVDAIEIVLPEDVSVLAPTGRPALTLVTCFPFYFIGSAPQRFIVHTSIEEAEPRRGGEDKPRSKLEAR